MLWSFVKFFVLGLLVFLLLPWLLRAWPYVLAALAVAVALGLAGWPPPKRQSR